MTSNPRRCAQYVANYPAGIVAMLPLRSMLPMGPNWTGLGVMFDKMCQRWIARDEVIYRGKLVIAVWPHAWLGYLWGSTCRITPVATRSVGPRVRGMLDLVFAFAILVLNHG